MVTLEFALVMYMGLVGCGCERLCEKKPATERSQGEYLCGRYFFYGNCVFVSGSFEHTALAHRSGPSPYARRKQIYQQPTRRNADTTSPTRVSEFSTLLLPVLSNALLSEGLWGGWQSLFLKGNSSCAQSKSLMLKFT